jgi:urease accessory protein
MQPMQPRINQCGFASLHVGFVHGASTLLNCRSRTPVSLLTPRPRGESVWAYTSSFGGGMVAGDSVAFDITIDADATCFLGSQASNKIYRNPAGLSCSHRLRASLAENSCLVLAPDPVQCFAQARYEQRQTFHLAPTANLVLVDWLGAGRLSRGERWCFDRYASRNEIFSANRPTVIDMIQLNNRSCAMTNRFRAGRFNCFATAILFGPKIKSFAAELLEKINSEPIAPQSSLLLAASPLAEGALVRIAGNSIEQVGHALHDALAFVPPLLHDDPWLRKW